MRTRDQSSPLINKLNHGYSVNNGGAALHPISRVTLFITAPTLRQSTWTCCRTRCSCPQRPSTSTPIIPLFILRHRRKRKSQTFILYNLNNNNPICLLLRQFQRPSENIMKNVWHAILQIILVLLNWYFVLFTNVFQRGK